MVWAADIGAYFAGRRFGKRKLAPAVSHWEKLEGAFGGIACALLVSLAFADVLSVPLGASLLLFTVLMAVLSIFGDLFESVLKRTAEVKDSGGSCLGTAAYWIASMRCCLPCPWPRLVSGRCPPRARGKGTVMKPDQITILGATGSIGENTLAVLAERPGALARLCPYSSSPVRQGF